MFPLEHNFGLPLLGICSAVFSVEAMNTKSSNCPKVHLKDKLTFGMIVGFATAILSFGAFNLKLIEVLVLLGQQLITVTILILFSGRQDHCQQDHDQ